MELKAGFPSGMPLGGIGTGFIELTQNGKPGVLLINNNWAQPVVNPPGCFFAIRVELPDGSVSFKLLQKDVLKNEKEVTSLSYKGMFPISEIDYHCADIPLKMRVTAFSPLIPHDVEKSNSPGTVFIFRFENLYNVKIKLDLFISWENVLGCGGPVEGEQNSCRTGNYIDSTTENGVKGLVFKTTDSHKHVYSNSLGEYALLTAEADDTYFKTGVWNTITDEKAILQTLSAGGKLPNNHLVGAEGSVHPAGVLNCGKYIESYEDWEIPVVFSWFTPYHKVTENRNPSADEVLKQYAPLYEGSGETTGCGLNENADYGHFYQNKFQSAWDVGCELLANYKPLLKETRELHGFMKSSNLPEWLVEKIINDMNPLTANTVLTRNGTLATLEASRGMGGALGTMDQRLVAHAAYQLFYPQLNRTELDLFSGVQAKDGHIPHFCGNFYVSIGSSQVAYGDTTWPDLSCSFIIQCYRDLLSTGDKDFYKKMLPHIMKAYEWLKSADTDADGVPEGGSSWDVEHVGGLFVYTGTLWLATLRVMEKIASMESDNQLENEIKLLFKRAQENIIKHLWNGRYFNCNYNNDSGAVVDEIFPGQLAGEWVVRLLGLESILPLDMMKTALSNIYKHTVNRDYYRLIPIKTTKDGKLVGRDMDEQAWPQYTMVFLDCLAIYLGLEEQGMDNIQRFNEAVCEISGTPWTTTLWHDSRTGFPCGGRLDRYMNCTSSLFILNALSGFHHDCINDYIVLGPNCKQEREKLRLPLISSGYWAMLEVDTQKDKHILIIKFIKLFDNVIKISGIRVDFSWNSVVCKLNGTTLNPLLENGNGNSHVLFNMSDPILIQEKDELYMEYTV